MDGKDKDEIEQMLRLLNRRNEQNQNSAERLSLNQRKIEKSKIMLSRDGNKIN
jgi:hypothetical protein